MSETNFIMTTTMNNFTTQVEDVKRILQRRDSRITTDQSQLEDRLRRPSTDYDSCSSYASNKLDGLHAGHISKRIKGLPIEKEDAMSHKIIEKRRRDRMNSCLTELSLLIPSNYLKNGGRGRIEKTEIVEMGIKHIKHLQDLTRGEGGRGSKNTALKDKKPTSCVSWQCPREAEAFKKGFNECRDEAVHCFVQDQEEKFSIDDPIIVRLVAHLKRYLDGKSCLSSSQTTVDSILTDSDYCGSFRSNSISSNSDPDSVPPTTIAPTTNTTTTNAAPTDMRFYLHPRNKSFEKFRLPPRESHSDPIFNRPEETSVDLLSTVISPEPICKSTENTNDGVQFKFKKNMRDRFSHEFGPNHDLKPGSRISDSEIQSQANSCSDRKRFSCDKLWKMTSPAAAATNQSGGFGVSISPEREAKKTIPIFALHPQGSHYIPLAIDGDLIPPFLLPLFEMESEYPLMLHPVTISVNYCGPSMQTAAHQQQMPPNPKSAKMEIKEGEEDHLNNPRF